MSVNPIIGRELTQRMRGARSYLAISIFVGILAIATYLIFETVVASNSRYDITTRTGAGRAVFEWTVLIMTALVGFFLPGFTAGAIAGERERQTLATLQVTLLRTRSILVGKVLSAVAFLLLLVVAATPVLAVSYVLGGITVREIFLALVAIVLFGVILAMVMVAVSSLTKRVQTATILAYGVAALVCLFGPLMYLVASILDGRTPDDEIAAPAWMLLLSPLMIIVDLATGNRTAGNGPLSQMRGYLAEAKARNDGSWWAWFPDPVDFVHVNEAMRTGRPLGPGPAAWVLSLGASALFAVVLLVLAARRLRTPADTER